MENPQAAGDQSELSIAAAQQHLRSLVVALQQKVENVAAQASICKGMFGDDLSKAPEFVPPRLSLQLKVAENNLDLAGRYFS